MLKHKVPQNFIVNTFTKCTLHGGCVVDPK